MAFGGPGRDLDRVLGAAQSTLLACLSVWHNETGSRHRHGGSRG